MASMAARPSDNAAAALVQLEELNAALHALAEVFPNVRPVVFREMLTTLSQQSRAQVVAEHLLRSGDTWVRGRWRVDKTLLPTAYQVRDSEAEKGRSRSSPRDRDRKPATTMGGGARAGGLEQEVELQQDGGRGGEALVPVEESFRTLSYRVASMNALRSEFRSLSGSTVATVLVEQNHCYTLARPILTALAAKTWRGSLKDLMARAFNPGTSQTKTTNGAAAVDTSHYMLEWTPMSANTFGSTDKALQIPSLRPTGDAELYEELRVTVLEPILEQRRQVNEQVDLEFATLLNNYEAESAGAMYECQVCFADATFERITFCSGSSDSHVVCFDCVQRSVVQAVYGQSWDLTIDHERGQVSCIAPSDTPCDGCMPQALTERAILAAKGGSELWRRLQSRMAAESIQASGVPTVQCPFCPYTEIDALHLPSTPTWTLNKRRPLRTTATLILGIDVAAIVFIHALLFSGLICLPLFPFLNLPLNFLTLKASVQSAWQAALQTNIRRQHLPQRFRCRSPACARSSCLDCRKAWCDPHRCYESAALSLRTTVEAARSEALKRTCPRCGVSFVKSSGCNKMVCVCGYTMCYICRQGLKAKGSTGAVPALEEGYRHFCQHFRPNGGECTECKRCDLYRTVDEKDVVKRAGETAEREWRTRNCIPKDAKLVEDADNDTAGGATTQSRDLRSVLKGLTMQSVLAWWIARVLVCKLEPVGREES